MSPGNFFRLSIKSRDFGLTRFFVKTFIISILTISYLEIVLSYVNHAPASLELVIAHGFSFQLKQNRM